MPLKAAAAQQVAWLAGLPQRGKGGKGLFAR